MNLRRLLLIFFIALGPPLVAQTYGPFVINATTSPCARVDVGSGNSSVGITVNGTFSMTLQPSVAIAGQASANAQVTPSTSTTAQSTITAAGVYKAEVAGYQLFQVCASAYVSGTATIYLQLSTGVNASLFGAGSSTVSSVTGDGTIFNNSGSTGAVTLSLTNTATGTGGVVLKTSPTLVTPNVGVATAVKLLQNASGNWGGTCSMITGTTCTFAITTAFTAPLCIASQSGTAATPVAAECSVSATTVTITAASSNSSTFAAFVFGNPN